MKFRDVLIFLAGGTFFHTISHIVFPFLIALPINMGFMMLTPAINTIAIAASLIMTVLLLWWASRLH